MNFLAPLFLLGALAVAAPVIFHLIRRTTRERTVFSSLMFLMPTPPRLTRRSRLEHWLLLLLRGLALGLLAFGFSRPFLKESALNDTAGGEAKRVVLLMDVSASMRRAGLWTDAVARAEAQLKKMSAIDEVAIFTFGRDAQPLLNFGEWTATAPDARVALATARLAATSPGWSGTNVGTALVTAAEALSDTEGEKKATGPRQIVLISDLQAGSRLEALQAYEWPKGMELFVEQLKARNPTNAGVQLLAEAADSDRQSIANVRLRVSNAADSIREQFKIGWVAATGGDFIGTPVDTYVPPGQSRVVSLPVTTAPGVDRIVLRGDDEDFDNTLFVIPPAQQKIYLVYFGAEKADDLTQPLFFLQRAMPATPRLAINVVAQSSAQPLTAELTASAAMFVVTDPLSTGQAAALREQTLAGRTVLAAPKNIEAAASLAALLGLERLAVDEGRPAKYAMLAEIDFQHPLFAPFADPRYSDFTKIHFWKYRRLDAAAIPGARAVAKFDNGDPALLEVPVGKGRVLILAAGWNPDDSQLAVSSKFVPLLFSTLELSGAVSVQTSQTFVGDFLPLPASRDATVSLVGPDGKAIAPIAATPNFTAATLPGIYRLSSGVGSTGYAVNLDAAETRTAPLPVEELERLGAPLARSKAAVSPDRAARETVLQGSAAEGRQKLWRWFILATLFVLLTESALAGWTARKSALSPQTSPS